MAWLAASSLLLSSTAAIVHTHEHSAAHEHVNDLEASKPARHSHSGCQHHQHPHAKPDARPDAPADETPEWPHSRDDCSLCRFLLEHPLPPAIVELPLYDVVVEVAFAAPERVAFAVPFDRPPARGPPCQA